MVLFTWSDKFSVNHQRMDEHHRRLVSLMNELDEAISTKRGDEVVGAAIEELARYAAEHLREEDRFMEAIQYPDRENHRAIHKFFADEIALLRLAYATGHLVRVQSIAQFLRDWFVHHIFSEDLRYGVFIHETSVRAA
jgi:hemerythrin